MAKTYLPVKTSSRLREKTLRLGQHLLRNLYNLWVMQLHSERTKFLMFGLFVIMSINASSSNSSTKSKKNYVQSSNTPGFCIWKLHWTTECSQPSLSWNLWWSLLSNGWLHLWHSWSNMASFWCFAVRCFEAWGWSSSRLTSVFLLCILQQYLVGIRAFLLHPWSCPCRRWSKFCSN